MRICDKPRPGEYEELLQNGFMVGGRKRKINNLVDSMVAELSDVMRARGYAPTSPLVVDISDDAVWFASEVGEGVGFTRSVIRIDIGWLPDGSAIVNARALWARARRLRFPSPPYVLSPLDQSGRRISR